jgi:hypothetical protein
MDITNDIVEGQDNTLLSEDLNDTLLSEDQDDDKSLSEEELDDETRNIVFNTKLKNIDSLYNTKIKKKNTSNLKTTQVKKNNLNILDLKPKRHFNPRLPPWDERLINKTKNNNNKLDFNNKNMFPEL